jgi:hypothetical protein
VLNLSVIGCHLFSFSFRKGGFMDSLQKKIQERAYNLYLERGGKPGHEMEDWARAEKEISAQKATIETKSSAGQQAKSPITAFISESNKKSQPAQNQEINPAKKIEKKLQSVNSRN